MTKSIKSGSKVRIGLNMFDKLEQFTNGTSRTSLNNPINQRKISSCGLEASSLNVKAVSFRG